MVKLLSGLKKTTFLFCGWLCLILGIIGIFLPLLPTTPFALLAAYFFSKSSQKLHSWLLRQKSLGPLIYNWEKDGVIPFRAKLLSSVMMTTLFSYSLIFVKVNLWIKGSIVLIGLAVLTFIWSRPSEKRTSKSSTANHDSLNS